MKSKITTKRRKGQYSYLPNLFTLFNLTLGFVSILINSLELGNIRYMTISAGFIFLAVLLDGLDGAVARMLKADSKLGAQLDSLADLVTGGLAPAFLMFSFIFFDTNYLLADNFNLPLGMFIASIWPMCAAYRLSRFNVQSKESNSFSGLPAPTAAVAIATVPIIFSYFPIPSYWSIFFFLLLSFLMVSTTRFPKPQAALFRRFSKARAIAIILTFLLVIIYTSIQWNIAYGTIIILIPLLIYLSVGLTTLIIEMIQKFRL